jgi:hypothetical protein
LVVVEKVLRNVRGGGGGKGLGGKEQRRVVGVEKASPIRGEKGV